MTMSNKPIYNSWLIKNFSNYVKTHYRHVNLNDVYREAGMEPHEVEDESHWFTQLQVDLFYEKVVSLTGNENIAREVGRYAVSPAAIGVMKQYFLSMVSPEKAYELIGKCGETYSLGTVYKFKKLSPNMVEITATTRPGVHEKPYQCENRLGYLEAMALGISHKLPKILHQECMSHGGNTCRYLISWEKVPSDLWTRIRNVTVPLMVFLCLIAAFKYQGGTLLTIASSAATLSLLISFYVKHLKGAELLEALGRVRSSTDQLMDQMNSNYKSTQVINDIGLTLSKQMSTKDILESVIGILQKNLEYERGMIMLVNEENDKLIYRAGFGYTDAQYALIRDAEFNLDKPESRGIFVRAFYEKKPFLVNDINEIESTISSRSMKFAQAMDIRSFICCPIIYEHKSLGILAVDNIRSNRPLLQSDLQLLAGIAPSIGISIHNYNLIESRKRQFNSILMTLAASIDARDFLTAGHSQRVTEIAVGICRELFLSENDCEAIRVASLLHDYGKIGIKDSILKKKGPLTVQEYEEIKTHAEKTRTILMEINFEGIYQKVPDIAGAHHEKIDGSGYPKGLKGEDIPIGARIIAVADFFEAVTAKRHYRDPMSIDVAIKMLKERRDTEYDSEIVDAFLRYYEKNKGANVALLPRGLYVVNENIASDKSRKPFNKAVSE